MLAICEPPGWDTRVWGIIGPLLLVIVWGLALVLIWRRADAEDQGWLAALFLVGAALGGVLFLVPEGVRGNADHLARFELSVALAAVLGTAAALVRRRPPLRSLGATVAGDVVVPGALVLGFVWTTSVGGGCIG